MGKSRVRDRSVAVIDDPVARFTCECCGKVFRCTWIGECLYQVNGMHFARVVPPKTDVSDDAEGVSDE